jgi:hypothetical protein
VFDASANAYVTGYALQASDPAGEERWRTGYGQPATGWPAVTASGALVTLDGDLLAGWGDDGRLAWSAPLPGESNHDAGLTIGADGSLLVRGLNYGRSLGYFTAHGAKQWIYTDEYRLSSRPAIDEQGDIYFISDHVENPPPLGARAGSQYPWGWQEGWLKSIARNGAPRWSTPLAAQSLGPPTVADDGGILVIEGETLACYEPADGRLRWRYDPQPESAGCIALGQDGCIYLLCQPVYVDEQPESAYSALHAVDAAGQRLWRVDLGTTAQLELLTDGAGRVYVSCGGSYYFTASARIYDAAGQQIWELPVELQLPPPVDNGYIAQRLDPQGQLHVFIGDRELVFAAAGAE